MLSLSSVLMSNELTVQTAGFGLRTVLEVCGNSQNTQLRASLFSTNGTYLGNAEYISPERVLEGPADTGSDIYALGVMLFELLSGTLPFRGANPLDIALKRIQQPVPSLHAVCPDMPEALDLVISKTMEGDPAKRYQRAGDSAAAFERVLQVLEAVERSSTPRGLQLALEPQLTLPPTINWFDEDALPAISHTSSTDTAPRLGTSALPSQSLRDTGYPAVVQPARASHMPPEDGVLPHPGNNHGNSLTGIDPFAWWFTSTTKAWQPEPGTFTRKPQRPPVRLANTGGRRQIARQDRHLHRCRRRLCYGRHQFCLFGAGLEASTAGCQCSGVWLNHDHTGQYANNGDNPGSPDVPYSVEIHHAAALADARGPVYADCAANATTSTAAHAQANATTSTAAHAQANTAAHAQADPIAHAVTYGYGHRFYQPVIEQLKKLY